jgi:hypothetical protein
LPGWRTGKNHQTSTGPFGTGIPDRCSPKNARFGAFPAQSDIDMFISFSRYNIPAGRAKWAYRVSMLGLPLLAIALIADRVVHAPWVALGAFMAAWLSVLVTFIIAVPGLMLSFAFLGAPSVFVIIGIAHNHQLWKTWWFWVITVFCEIVGALLLARFDVNNRK